MRYSLIIPHFNDPERLARLLRTVPTDRDGLEVIVVDDCSPDPSALDPLKEEWPRVRWMSTTRNGGAGAARNVGLEHARGMWLVFADADDEFLPGAFDVFDEHVGPGDELVYFLAEAVQEVDRSPSNRTDRMNELCLGYLDAPSDKKLEALKLGHVNPVAKVYSRDFIESVIGRFEETHVSNDVRFNVLAAVQATRIRVVPKTVYRLFRRKGSLTGAENVEALLARMRVLGRVNQALEVLPVSGRMHAGGYLYRGLQQGPLVFFRVLREAFANGLFWPMFRRLTIREVLGFVRRSRRAGSERARM
ncbi:glycosyltransferase family 2 protein [Thioalkalivibrio sp. ALJ3]|uniref:glycosyltransferase family 2 protein n=1 Tax=Thioalkalivibrio sp. ALJ3 TaxID=1240557 RepID=UPI000570E9B1|nr:glycosyltransferase family 2 protein [Thioalkalivibrio sp. ALJ3]